MVSIPLLRTHPPVASCTTSVAISLVGCTRRSCSPFDIIPLVLPPLDDQLFGRNILRAVIPSPILLPSHGSTFVIRLKMLSSEDLASIAVAIVYCDEEPRKKRRWVKDCDRKRPHDSHVDLLNEFKFSGSRDIGQFIRMDSESFGELLEMVRPVIAKKNTVMRDAIPASQRLSVTLRYLATGSSFGDLKSSSAISPQSIGQIVMETCKALIHCLKGYIQLPKTEEEWKGVARGFEERWNFPNCVGAIDGHHVETKKPTLSGSSYHNDKYRFFSIVLLALVNSKYEFLMADAGIKGRVSDEDVFDENAFGKLVEERSLRLPEPQCSTYTDRKLPFVFVAGEPFTMTENVLKAYARSELDAKKKRIFNRRLSRARGVVEKAFGILTHSFGVFQGPINLAPEKAQVVILACCYLHNFLAMTKRSSYMDESFLNEENLDSGKIAGVHPISFQKSNASRNPTDIAGEARDSYCDYFNNEGKVPWQDECSS
ncbi:uncharacterized protein [Macrobrachium rosenbergii]|uniref:uncharacterized protein n=1 Tax=Macrobrachium rosenbergii TaxID=79674 RepID=UPI0034D457AB